LIVIVDYGVGNLESIRNMFKRIGVQSLVSSRESDILQAEKLVLPGVGAFDACAQKINASGLKDSLRRKVLDEHIPVLGICVGMQLLMEESEEGSLKGLGWIPGKVVKFRQEKMPYGIKVPHIGWADVRQVKSSAILKDMPEAPRFYFVHSFHVKTDSEEDVLLSADYGYRFCAAVQHENIIGVQFHPEKSHKYGMKLLENFAKNY
jgi:glutamine amidotransferase